MIRPRIVRGGAAVAFATLLAWSAAGCTATPGGPPTAGVSATTGAPRVAGAVRRPRTVAPVRASATGGIRVDPPIRMPNGALLLTLPGSARDEALRGAPAAVGSLDHRAVGSDPGLLLDRYFRSTSRDLEARVRVTEADVDRRTARDDEITAEGFRYRIDLFVVRADEPDAVLFSERGEGEASWLQSTDPGPAAVRQRADALPQLARLAFQAALTDLQARVRDRRDVLMAIGRASREAADAAGDAVTPETPPPPPPTVPPAG